MVDSLKLNAGSTFFATFKDLAPAAYTPENIHLGDYVFVPYVRNGLSAAIAVQPSGNRVTIRAEIDVADSANPASAKETVSRDLTLYGPGDVIGVDPGAIIRREPAAGTSDAEEGYLAHVEFGRPDIPWMFSPLPAAGDACQPWIALIVCEASVSKLEPSKDQLPARIHTQKGQLQSLADCARYAHAQVVGAALDGDAPLLRGDSDSSVQARLSDDHAPANLSRLLCPRRIDDGVSYIAAIVPTFDCGVKAGLGASGGTLAPAWSRASGDEQDEITLPVYDSWTFRTAKGGNFQELAERIKGIGAPWAVGRKLVDVSKPGSGIAEVAAGTDGGVQVLECALFSPALNGPAAPAAYPVARREELRQRVDAANVDTPDLPRVGARLYARYQRAADRLGQIFAGGIAAADADWFNQLSSDPKHRIVAGLGARVVQKDQEQLMQAAWAQVDGIRRANQAIAWAAFAQRVNQSFSARHIEPLEMGRMMQVTRNVQTRIHEAGRQRTVAAAVLLSRTADSTVEAAFRRAMRPNGPLAKRQSLPVTAAANLVATATGFRDHRIAYVNPDGIDGVSATGRQFFDTATIAKVLNVTPDRAPIALAEKLDVFKAKGPALQALQTETWSPPKTQKPGDAFGAEVLTKSKERINTLGVNATSPEAGLLGQVLTGIINTGGVLREGATAQLGDIVKVLPKQDLNPIFAKPLGPVLTPVAPAAIPGAPGITIPLRRNAPVVVSPRRAADIIMPRADVPAPVRLETQVSRNVTAAIGALNALGGDAYLKDLRAVVTTVLVPPKPQTDLGQLNLTKPALLAQIEPTMTARLALKGRITGAQAVLNPNWFETFGLTAIMAAPVFNRAMYAALEDYDRDWLVPGLGTIAERDFVTLLSINPSFAEAFLVGASDEMGRELLWRDYPTDQRGTYFKRFWDADEDELTAPIHRFSRQPLGQHFSIGGNAGAGAGALALVVRGELLRRFPNTFIAAMRATLPDGPPIFIAEEPPKILFHAHLSPDYTIVGFDLTVERVMGNENWWFVLAQNPTAPRFGLASNPSVATTHDTLDWADFGQIPPGGFLSTGRSFAVSDPESHPSIVQWPGHAGVVARVLLTNPIRAAFRAKKLITSIRSSA